MNRKKLTLSSFRQYARFLATGIVNTAIDFGVLNTLILLFGPIVKPVAYALFKVLSFLAAITNSYFLNKYWVFADGNQRVKASTHREKILFLGVSVFSLGVNLATSLLVFRALGKIGFMGATAQANIGAIAGTALTQISNFLGYKFLIFKRPHEQHLPFGDSPGIPGRKEDSIDTAGSGAVLQGEAVPVRDYSGQ